MKTLSIISISLLLLLNAMTSGANNDTTSVAEYNDRSLILFCESRGYDIDSITPAQYDEYLDAWAGSIEEENAMDNENF